MRVEELVGWKVWVKEANRPTYVGYISSVTEPAEADDIQDAIDASFFRVKLTSGDVVEIPGTAIVDMDDDGSFEKG
jgi:RNase P/RNase MRP subunit p29